MLEREFEVSGGSNKLISQYGNNIACSYTTTGTNLKPVRLLPYFYDNNGEKHNNFIIYDAARSIGFHSGNTRRCSEGCIRVSQENSEYLYELVKKNYTVDSKAQLIDTNVSIEVTDSTENRYKSECQCLKKLGRKANPKRVEKVCSTDTTF
ncbi:MAG: L,D-transpeptidase [Bdellovibrionaceae bacterium]|nr:L,D-transpeptidase [Pseudobdellovibrionaceae bacterium]